LNNKEITSAIVGARKKGQIAETVKAADWKLEESELNSISKAIDEFQENIA
jgi:aryl-alcohol dehydrogenase-like predicted oxidoreductase